MAKERLFFTGSVRIISDARLTATEIRVYACVSLHDGMSLVKGKGAGCFASNLTLAEEVGCDYSTLCKALSKLVELGYLVKKTSSDDRRMKVYRVPFPTQNEWRVHHTTDDEIGGEAASPRDEIGGGHLSETDAKPPETAEHYIPLKVELDSVETEELDSENQRTLNGARLGKIEFEDNLGGQLARLERSLRAGESIDCPAWDEWLTHIIENFDDNALRSQAARLAELVVEAMNEDEYAQWGLKHGWVDDEGKWHCPNPREAA